MTRIDRLLLSAIYLPILPILLFLLGWWGSVGLLPEDKVFIPAVTGLAIGLILDACYWRRWLRRGYGVKAPVMAALYAFYSVCILGFFMGVPVFNVLPGVFAGVYAARKAVMHGQDRAAAQGSLRRAAWFCVTVLAVFSVASALLALADPYTAANLEGMLHLGLTVTEPMIYGLIVVGGGGLLFVQYGLVILAGRWILARSQDGAQE